MSPREPADDAREHDRRPPLVKRCADPDELAERVAAQLIGTLARVQGLGRSPSVVLTGGGIARRIHAAVAAAPEVGLVDWAAVDVWFGDERYVPADDAERNAGQAATDLLSGLPGGPGRVREMPASDAGFEDVESAAAAYAESLTAWAPARGPWFDVIMLGVGPDGHCASLFPGRPEVASDLAVLPVRNAPKPPPTRISMGMSTLRRAREVWFVASGAEKAEAVAAGVHGADVRTAPAAGPHGLERTLWFVTEDAAWMV